MESPATPQALPDPARGRRIPSEGRNEVTLDRVLAASEPVAALEAAQALIVQVARSTKVGVGILDDTGGLVAQAPTSPSGAWVWPAIVAAMVPSAAGAGPDITSPWLLSQPISEGHQVIGIVFPREGVSFRDVEKSARLALLAVARTVLLERDRSRVDEIDRLVATAKRVAASLELQTVLEQIVQDATELLRADSGDMLLWDRERDLLKVVAVDRFPSEMLGLEFAFGEGLSSHAIIAGRPIIVGDYRGYEHRLVGLDQYDFRSVVCAPVIVRDAAIGALNVHALGKPRHFRRQDAELLAAFADLAAIAIDHARRYENETRLGQELSHANGELSRLLTVQRRLSEHVILDHGIELIARELALQLDRPLVVQDHLWRVIAGAAPDAGESWRSIVVPRSAVRDRRQRKTRDPLSTPGDDLEWTYTRADGEVRSVAPVRVGREIVGYLVLPRDHDLTALDRALTATACTGLALEFAKLRARVEVEQRVRGDAVMDLLTGSYSSEEAMAARATHLGYDLTESHDVLVLEIDDFHVLTEKFGEENALRLKQRFYDVVNAEITRRAPGSVVTAQSDALILLVASRRGTTSRLMPETLALDLRKLVAVSLPEATVSVAIGDPCSRPRDYSPSFRLAREALDVMHKLGRRGVVIGPRQLGAYRLLLKASSLDELRAYVGQTLGALLDPDLRGGLDLVHTLRAYLEEGQSQRAAAHRCSVHVNTVVYRLRRIEDLLGVNLADANVVFDLTLALRILDVTEPQEAAPV